MVVQCRLAIVWSPEHFYLVALQRGRGDRYINKNQRPAFLASSCSRDDCLDLCFKCDVVPSSYHSLDGYFVVLFFLQVGVMRMHEKG